MSKFLITARYTPPEGIKGLIADGGTTRSDAIKRLAESVGGKVESIYYAFGETDILIICELPTDEAAAAISLTVGATGLATTQVTKLLTIEQIDNAVKMSPAYDAPGPSA